MVFGARDWLGENGNSDEKGRTFEKEIWASQNLPTFFRSYNDIFQSTIWVEYFIWLLQDSEHKFTGSLNPNKCSNFSENFARRGALPCSVGTTWTSSIGAATRWNEHGRVDRTYPSLSPVHRVEAPSNPSPNPHSTPRCSRNQRKWMKWRRNVTCSHSGATRERNVSRIMNWRSSIKKASVVFKNDQNIMKPYPYKKNNISKKLANSTKHQHQALGTWLRPTRRVQRLRSTYRAEKKTVWHLVNLAKTKGKTNFLGLQLSMGRQMPGNRIVVDLRPCAIMEVVKSRGI